MIIEYCQFIQKYKREPNCAFKLYILKMLRVILEILKYNKEIDPDEIQHKLNFLIPRNELREHSNHNPDEI